MRASQPSAKIYCSRFDVPLRDFIAVFHGWIQRSRTGDLLIDVHDYSHVHHGPGVILIAHECFYFVDQGEGRPGLLWRRRRGEPVAARQGLRDAALAAARACALLEEDVGDRLRFDTSEVLLGFDDRSMAPNTPDVFGQLAPDLEALGGELYPDAAVEVTQAGEIPRGCFRARLRAAVPMAVPPV